MKENVIASKFQTSFNNFQENLSQIFKQVDWNLVSQRLNLYEVAYKYAKINLHENEFYNIIFKIDEALMNAKLEKDITTNDLLLNLRYNKTSKSFILTIFDKNMDNKSSNVYEYDNDTDVIIISTL